MSQERKRQFEQSRTVRSLAIEAMMEQHFSPRDLAKLWRLDVTTIRRQFADEPGVFKLGRSDRRDGKRDYICLRIPASVAERVYRRRTA